MASLKGIRIALYYSPKLLRGVKTVKYYVTRLLATNKTTHLRNAYICLFTCTRHFLKFLALYIAVRQWFHLIYVLLCVGIERFVCVRQCGPK